MGRVEDRESLDHPGGVHRNRPGDASAPVVTAQPRGLGTKFSNEAADVVSQQGDGIVFEVLGLRGRVVAARGGRDAREPRRCKRRDLRAPTEPELWEAMQQNDQRTVTGLDVMQL